VRAQFQRCGAASTVWEGVLARALFKRYFMAVGPPPRAARAFLAAVLPKIPIRSLNLGDRISPTSVTRGRAAGYRHAYSSSDMAPPVRFGEVVQPGRFSAKSKHLSAKAIGYFRYFCPSRIDPDS
jgi:hypothetical protein